MTKILQAQVFYWRIVNEASVASTGYLNHLTANNDKELKFHF